MFIIFRYFFRRTLSLHTQRHRPTVFNLLWRKELIPCDLYKGAQKVNNQLHTQNGNFTDRLTQCFFLFFFIEIRKIPTNYIFRDERFVLCVLCIWRLAKIQPLSLPRPFKVVYYSYFCTEQLISLGSLAAKIAHVSISSVRYTNVNDVVVLILFSLFVLLHTPT